MNGPLEERFKGVRPERYPPEFQSRILETRSDRKYMNYFDSKLRYTPYKPPETRHLKYQRTPNDYF